MGTAIAVVFQHVGLLMLLATLVLGSLAIWDVLFAARPAPIQARRAQDARKPSSLSVAAH